MSTENLIDKLLENEEWFCIDVFPKTVHRSIYFDIEEYLLDTYIKEYAEKIVRIIIKVLAYYPAQIYVTEYTKTTTNKIKSSYPVGENLYNKSIKELAEIISFAIIQGKTSINILFEDDRKFLVNVKDGFQVGLYNLSDEHLKLISFLVEREGLFLRKL